jgi:hypothetical protein
MLGSDARRCAIGKMLSMPTAESLATTFTKEGN